MFCTVRKAVGGIWTKANDGKYLLYFFFREACVVVSHVAMEGVTQFGIDSSAPWKGAPP